MSTILDTTRLRLAATLLLAFLAAWFFAACSDASPETDGDADTAGEDDVEFEQEEDLPKDGVCVWQEDARPERLFRLGCPADHEALSGVPESSALPANRSVLFLIDRRDGQKVHFFDSERWRHFTYAAEKLSGFMDMGAFNAEMYYQPSRRLLLGTLVYYLGPDIYAVEIAPIDKASPEMIEELFRSVESALGFEADLRYHPTSNALEMESRLPDGVAIVTTAELYEGATYQGMHLGESVGQIRILSLEALEDEYISRLDIVVVDRVPNDIAAVAGLVTGEFQTPLAHVNLLAESRGTPNMALIDAESHPDFVANEGKWVRLSVRADGFSLQPSSYEDALQFWDARRPLEPQTPRLDLSFTELIDIEDIDSSFTPAVGGKAANFGELKNIEPPLPVPDAFAIPVSAYVRFMQETGLQDEIDALRAEERFREDGLYRMQALADFRDKIRAAAPDPLLIEAIEDKIEARLGSGPIRFRSSSNAEDLLEFNGAGLYDSVSYKPGDPEKTIPHALLKVWASLWNHAAFEEREWARVDHAAVAMGVLVHRSFPDEIEAANGVAITANPFDPPPNGQAAYYVNVQVGAVSVANPEPGVTPECFLYYKPPAGQGEMTYFSRSSLTQSDPVLSFEEIRELVQALKAIHDHFAPIYGRTEPFAMDVEFKFELPGRQLAVKQARPYIW
ncbi:MAG: hypothetical protein C4523_17685 [Myxococcales bacterium]|nr:MAG: hypothetical protein C4523_17685 [Myxococcales bacterium]